MEIWKYVFSTIYYIRILKREFSLSSEISRQCHNENKITCFTNNFHLARSFKNGKSKKNNNSLLICVFIVCFETILLDV